MISKSDKAWLERLDNRTQNLLSVKGILSESDAKWLEDTERELQRLLGLDNLTSVDRKSVTRIDTRLNAIHYPRGSVFATEIAAYRAHLEGLNETARKTSATTLYIGTAGLGALLISGAVLILGAVKEARTAVGDTLADINKETRQKAQAMETQVTGTLNGLERGTEDRVKRAVDAAVANAEAQIRSQINQQFFDDISTEELRKDYQEKFIREACIQVGNELIGNLITQRLALLDQAAHPEKYQGQGIPAESVPNVLLVFDEMIEQHSSGFILNLKPDEIESLSRTILGITHLCSRQIPTAEACFRQACKLNGKNFAAHRLGIISKLITGRIVEPTAVTTGVPSKSDLTKSFADNALDNFSGTYIVEFAQGMHDMAGKRFDEAIEHYSEALTIVRNTMANPGLQLRVAASLHYQIAYAKLRKMGFILDLGPPPLDQLEACRQLRKEALTQLYAALDYDRGDPLFLAARNAIVWERTHFLGTDNIQPTASEKDRTALKIQLNVLERNPASLFSASILDTLMDAHCALGSLEQGRKIAYRLEYLHTFIERPNAKVQEKVKKRLAFLDQLEKNKK